MRFPARICPTLALFGPNLDPLPPLVSSRHIISHPLAFHDSSPLPLIPALQVDN
jgi:hypothetical protein